MNFSWKILLISCSFSWSAYLEAQSNPVVSPFNARISVSLGAVLSGDGNGKVIANFEKETDISAWSFYNGAEFPGAKGSIVAVTAYGGKCAELRYDFRPPLNPATPFNPAYVQASTPVSAEQASGAYRLRLKMRMSSSTIKGRLRVEDSSGQTLQYELPGTFPFTAVSTESWMQATVDLSKPSVYWNGINDGMVHAPIKTVSVLIEARGATDTGWLRFDDLQLLGDPAPVNVRLSDTSLFTPAVALGSLEERVGVNVHFTKDDRAMDIIGATGFRWIRMDATWAEIEKVAGRYDFSAYDELVSAATSRGLRVMAILDYGHPIHTGGGMKPPRTLQAIQAYGAFCQAMAEHYAGRDVAFEIWNEPNLAGFWDGAPSAVEYAAVLRAGIDAVKRGNSTARVVTGGLSTPNELTYAFWDELEKRGAMTGAGGLGAHLYWSDAPETRWTDVLLLRERVLRVMPGQQVWCTEWGYSSTHLSPNSNGHDAIGRKIQAGKVVRQLLTGWWANLPLEVLYDIRDDGDDAFEAENNFGLLAQDYTEKPAMTAARTLLNLAKGRQVGGLMVASTLPSTAHILRLDGSAENIFVVWVEEFSPPFSIQLPDRPAHVRDMLGRLIWDHAGSAAKSIDVDVTSGPIYIEVPR